TGDEPDRSQRCVRFLSRRKAPPVNQFRRHHGLSLSGSSPDGKLLSPPAGEMSEWFKEHAWKACVRETVPRVRIPFSPPAFAGLTSSRLRLGRRGASAMLGE